jgi:hypothetical protein
MPAGFQCRRAWFFLSINKYGRNRCNRATILERFVLILKVVTDFFRERGLTSFPQAPFGEKCGGWISHPSPVPKCEGPGAPAGGRRRKPLRQQVPSDRKKGKSKGKTKVKADSSPAAQNDNFWGLATLPRCPLSLVPLSQLSGPGPYAWSLPYWTFRLRYGRLFVSP